MLTELSTTRSLAGKPKVIVEQVEAGGDLPAGRSVAVPSLQPTQKRRLLRT